MGMLEFYSTALVRAFLESVSLSQAAVFLAVAAVGLFGNRLRDSAAAHAGITSGKTALVILVALLCARFPFAIYSLWDDEHSGRLRAECLLAQANDGQSQRKAFIGQNLQGFYAKTQELMHRKITPDQFPAWAVEEGRLASEMAGWVNSNMGAPAVARLQDMDGPSYDFSGMPSISAEYVGALNWLNKVSANLQILQRQPEWDSFKTTTALKCP
ncbi:MAG TPA: hypothetical protein VKT73_01635 [Xanthobacteraceae bacterium]|nr:hypothetical protein [Xanthobacteraceae bacterium]